MSSRVANKTWFLHIEALMLHLTSAKSEQTARADPTWFFGRADMWVESWPLCRRIA